MNRIKITTIGYVSFLTKKLYKTKTARAIAESKFKAIRWAKQTIAKRQAIRTLNTYKRYSKQLLKQKGSFMRWSELKAVREAVNELRISLPKQTRVQLNWNLTS